MMVRSFVSGYNNDNDQNILDTESAEKDNLNNNSFLRKVRSTDPYN